MYLLKRFCCWIFFLFSFLRFRPLDPGDRPTPLSVPRNKIKVEEGGNRVECVDIFRGRRRRMPGMPIQEEENAEVGEKRLERAGIKGVKRKMVLEKFWKGFLTSRILFVKSTFSANFLKDNLVVTCTSIDIGKEVTFASLLCPIIGRKKWWKKTDSLLSRKVWRRSKNRPHFPFPFPNGFALLFSSAKSSQKRKEKEREEKVPINSIDVFP